MHSCRDIASRALRKIGKLGAGRDPRQADLDTTVAALRGIYRSLITAGAFGRMRDVIPTADYTARENERVFRSNTGCDQIKLPLSIGSVLEGGDPFDYGSRWTPPARASATQRPPRDCAVVEIVDGFTGVETQFIYDGHARKWQSLYDLTADVRAPLADRDPEGMASLLAAEINDEFGGGIGEMTLRRASEFRIGLTHRYSFARGTTDDGFM